MRHHLLTRRELVRGCGMGLLASPLLPLLGCKGHAPAFVEPTGAPYEGTDEQLLDEIQRASFDFFGTKRAPRPVK